MTHLVRARETRLLHQPCWIRHPSDSLHQWQPTQRFQEFHHSTGNCWKTPVVISPPPPHIKRSASDTVHLHLHYTINTAIHEPSSIKYNLYCILNNTVQNVTTVYKSPLIFHKNQKKTLLPSIHEIYCKLVENLVMRNILQTS